MKNKFFRLLSLSIVAVSLSSCDIFFNDNGDVEQLFDECSEVNGKWNCFDFHTHEDLNSYFEFDGNKGSMKFKYYEDDQLIRDGVFRVVYRGEKEDVTTPLSIGFEIKGDKKHRDWIDCFVKDFKTDFTQFTVMREERDLDINNISGIPQALTYRISEVPFAFGTYVKEGSQIKEQEDYRKIEDSYIPFGDYVHESGAKFSVFTTYYQYYQLFRYEDENLIVEGTFFIGMKKDTMFPWFKYQPGLTPTKEQKEQYPELNDVYDFPPNCNIYGSFDVNDNNQSIRIGRIEIIDGFGYDVSQCDWAIGTYNRTV